MGRSDSGRSVLDLRLRAVVRGAVQGVGFRPFVYHLARELELSGWVNNTSRGVFIEVEGDEERLRAFLLRLAAESPPRASIQSLESSFLDPLGYRDFEIRHSDSSGEKTVLVLPDIATCAACLTDITAADNRRRGYAFTNCTHCGPRYSIIESLPYDRPNTTMVRFALCDVCRREYEDPLDRRFHAQPNACADCGPQLQLWNRAGEVQEVDDPLAAAVESLRRGEIVALKGLGGFHLIVDAKDEAAVRRLRQVKEREEKPFAVMYATLEDVRRDCAVSNQEERLLTAPEAPIVLLERRADALAANVAPDNPHLGVLLPYTPLHHLLMRAMGSPLVATSGNLADEPICTDEREAVARLGPIADAFLVHDRPIERHVDDSIARVVAGRELVLRRARGFAPLPVQLKEEGPPVLAVGAHLKNAVAFSVGRQVFVSQHIGDLDAAEACAAFERVIADLGRLYGREPELVACDLHPDYRSTHFARARGLPVVAVQHHYAHVLSCMAENEVEGPVLGISWDGTGYGPDRTVWGGEFLRVDATSFERAAHLRTFPLPGGERAVREPRRAAVGLLHAALGDAVFDLGDLPPLAAFSAAEIRVVGQMLERGLNTPLTSSAGRLFDAVAALVGLRQRTRFEGQGAMELEFALDPAVDEAYDFELVAGDGPLVADWEPLVRGVLRDVDAGAEIGAIAARFHNALVEIMVDVARSVGEESVVLSGGCFQNKYLTERAVRRLGEEGFRPYWHQRIPPNDGGIALGQVAAAWRASKEEK